MTDEEMEVEQPPPENMETEEAPETVEEVKLTDLILKFFALLNLSKNYFLGCAKSLGRSPR